MTVIRVERQLHIFFKSKFVKRFKKNCGIEVPELYEGVKIADKLLETPELPKKAKVHDDVSLREDQKEVIESLPKDTLYSNITKKMMEKYRQKSEILIQIHISSKVVLCSRWILLIFHFDVGFIQNRGKSLINSLS